MIYIYVCIYIYRSYTTSICIGYIRQPVGHSHFLLLHWSYHYLRTTPPRQLTRNSIDHPAVVGIKANPGGAIVVKVRVRAGCW